MRIRISLQPFEYPAAMTANHHPLASFIYETVAVAAPTLAGWLHDSGVMLGDSDRRFKFFVFGIPELPRYRFAGGDKVFDYGVMHWQISSPISEFIEAFIAGLTTQRTVSIGRTQFEVVGIEIIEPPMFTEEMRLIALSPLMVAKTASGIDGRRESKYFLRASDEDFGQLVVANLLEKYRALFGTDAPDQDLRFEFDWEYIEANGGPESRKVTRLVQYKNLQIKGVLAPFYISGDPDLIRLGWECGFGSGNSQGFGLAGE